MCTSAGIATAPGKWVNLSNGFEIMALLPVIFCDPLICDKAMIFLVAFLSV